MRLCDSKHPSQTYNWLIKVNQTPCIPTKCLKVNQAYSPVPHLAAESEIVLLRDCRAYGTVALVKICLFITQNILEALVTDIGFWSFYTLVKVHYTRLSHLFQFLSSSNWEITEWRNGIALFLSSFAECQVLDDHLCIPGGMLRQVKRSLCVQNLK